MLNKYSNFNLNEATLIKPDPPGVRDIYATKSYSAECVKIQRDTISAKTKDIEQKIFETDTLLAQLKRSKTIATEEAKKDAAELMVKSLEAQLKGKVICLLDENERQKILTVEKVILDKKGNEYFPLIIEDDDHKIRYNWINEQRSKIFDLSKFLDFFETHYIDNLLSFTGRPVNGGKNTIYQKHIVRIGIHDGDVQDSLIVDNDDGTQELLEHTAPIKILDMKLKTLDPYGEEDPNGW